MIGPDPSKTASVTVPPGMPPGISLSTGEEVVQVPAGLAEGQTFSNDPQAANIVESSLELHVVQPTQPMQPALTPPPLAPPSYPPPPLPSGWKEAKDHAGVVYYIDTNTVIDTNSRETTYTRPITAVVNDNVVSNTDTVTYGAGGWGVHIEKLHEDPWAPHILHKVPSQRGHTKDACPRSPSHAHTVCVADRARRNLPPIEPSGGDVWLLRAV